MSRCSAGQWSKAIILNKFLKVLGAVLLVMLSSVVVNNVARVLWGSPRWDMTSDKLFTITAGTQKILKDIQNPINLYYFYSAKNLEASWELRQYAQQVKESLEAYQRYAPDLINLQVIDPQSSVNAAEHAASAGLLALTPGSNTRPSYFGLAGTNAHGDLQTIPSFDMENKYALDYQLSLLVQQLARPEPPVLGIISGLAIAGGYDPDTGKHEKPWLILDELGKRYKIDMLPSDSARVPSNVSVLMIVHPKKFSSETLFAIDQFVMRGGKVLAFVDPYSEQDKGVRYFGIPSLDRSSNLDILFKAWGIELLHGKVVGDGFYALEASRDPREQSVRVPTALGLQRDTVNPNDISTAGLAAINMTTAGVIKATKDAKTQFVPLIFSSNYSKLFETRQFESLIAPSQLMSELIPGGGRQYIMSARIRGPVKSAFPNGIEGHSKADEKTTEVDLIVVADTDMLTERMWSQSTTVAGKPISHSWADNETFVANALDDLFGSDELIPLRSRGIANHTFQHIERLQRQLFARQEREVGAAVIPMDLPAIQQAFEHETKALGDKLKLINLILTPLALLLFVLLIRQVKILLIKRRRIL